LVILSDYLAPDNSNAISGGFMGKPLPNFLKGKRLDWGKPELRTQCRIFLREIFIEL
jgi:hypothetical protein